MLFYFYPIEPSLSYCLYNFVTFTIISLSSFGFCLVGSNSGSLQWPTSGLNSKLGPNNSNLTKPPFNNWHVAFSRKRKGVKDPSSRANRSYLILIAYKNEVPEDVMMVISDLMVPILKSISVFYLVTFIVLWILSTTKKHNKIYKYTRTHNPIQNL